MDQYFSEIFFLSMSYCAFFRCSDLFPKLSVYSRNTQNYEVPITVRYLVLKTFLETNPTIDEKVLDFTPIVQDQAPSKFLLRYKVDTCRE
jgi:hypothetical protein